MDRKKWNIRLYYAVVFLQGMVFYAPIATLYRQANGLTVFDITLIEGFSLLLMILLEIPLGFVADRIGYKKTLVACNVLYFLSKVVFWQAGGFGMFLAERLMLSVVFAGVSGLDSAYLYVLAGDKDSHRAFGLYEAASAAGILVASAALPLLIGGGYRLTALLTAAAYAVATALSFFLPEVRPEQAARKPMREQLSDIRSAIFGNKRFLLFLVAAALLAQSSQTITVFLNQLQYLRSGIPAQAMGYLYILVTGASFASAFSWRLTARVGETRAMALLFAAAAASCLAMAVFANPVVSVAGILLLRASASLALPIGMQIQNQQVAVVNRATVLSVYSMAMDGAAVFTNLAFGKAADAGVSWAMGAGALFCLLGLGLFAVWRKAKGMDIPAEEQ